MDSESIGVPSKEKEEVREHVVEDATKGGVAGDPVVAGQELVPGQRPGHRDHLGCLSALLQVPL